MLRRSLLLLRRFVIHDCEFVDDGLCRELNLLVGVLDLAIERG
jgi:hypothetical protein